MAFLKRRFVAVSRRDAAEFRIANELLKAKFRYLRVTKMLTFNFEVRFVVR